MNIHFDATYQSKPKPMDFGNIESTIKVNSHYFTENGKPRIFVAGEFHFERYSREFWEEEILKMKAGGVDVVSAYIIWLFHEPKSGEYSFEGDFDDAYFLSLCRKHGMRVIMRIGPYVHGELRHGGLPDFVFRMQKNRSDDDKYLALVKRYWQKLYESTKDYYDGKTVVAIQLENEYVKGFGHLLTLRKLAEEIGFKTPIFTITGWGFTFDSNEILGTYGGYPARPWAQHKHRMEVQGNFTITGANHTASIGDDVIDYSKVKEPVALPQQPKMTCECGCGNQVTEHRREIISTNDAFGIPFAMIANGCNWLGYYMYHGGNNPRGRLYHESRITGSSNNLPVIDYDFQSPLGRFGFSRDSYKKLKSLNYFLRYFGDRLAPMRQYYDPRLEIKDSTDAVTPRISVRVDENGSGFLFASTYEREAKMPALRDVGVTVDTPCGKINLPALNIDTDNFLLYPFNITLGSVTFDYITASPVALHEKDGITTYYFKTTAELSPKYKTEGKSGTFEISDSWRIMYNLIDEKTRLVVMTQELADDFYIIDDKIIITDATVYGDGNITVEYKNGDYCVVDGKEIELDCPSAEPEVKLHKRKAFRCKYGRFLFSKGKREYYCLSVGDLLFDEKAADYAIDFDFKGTTFQMYSNGELVSDFYNCDGGHRMSLKYFKNELSGGRRIDIVAAPFTRIRKVYTEKDFEKNNAELVIKQTTAIFRKVV